MSTEKRLSGVDSQLSVSASRRNSFLRFSIAGFFGLRELFEREYSFEEVSDRICLELYVKWSVLFI